MNEVHGVYTLEDYRAVHSYLSAVNPQAALFWQFAVDTGYRVSDILSLRVSDVSQDELSILERKTKKFRTVALKSSLRDSMANYASERGLKPHHHLFFDTRKEVGAVPATRQSMWYAVKKAGQALGLPRLSLAHTLHARHLHGVCSSARRALRRSSKTLGTGINPQLSNTSNLASKHMPRTWPDGRPMKIGIFIPGGSPHGEI